MPLIAMMYLLALKHLSPGPRFQIADKPLDPESGPELASASNYEDHTLNTEDEAFHFRISNVPSGGFLCHL